MSSEYQQVEQKAREAFEAQDYDTAATVFIRHCGGEILTFLLGRVTNEGDASEVFSQFAEDFWRGLPNFQWRSTLRTWAYTLARNAAVRYFKAPHRRHERCCSMSQKSQFAGTVAILKSATTRYRRTEIRDKFRRIREKLSEDDQMLLVLRVDRNLAFRELAMVWSGQGETLDEAEIARWSTRLRQRFVKIKERLKKLAREEGLLEHRTA